MWPPPAFFTRRRGTRSRTGGLLVWCRRFIHPRAPAYMPVPPTIASLLGPASRNGPATMICRPRRVRPGALPGLPGGGADAPAVVGADRRRVRRVVETVRERQQVACRVTLLAGLGHRRPWLRARRPGSSWTCRPLQRQGRLPRARLPPRCSRRATRFSSRFLPLHCPRLPVYRSRRCSSTVRWTRDAWGKPANPSPSGSPFCP